MHPIRLKSDVSIEAPNFWGFRGNVVFSPLIEKSNWWFWKTDWGSVRIEPEIIDRKTRRLRLSYENQKMEIFEHIGVLRWFGLCGVSIKSTPWPPYCGNSSAFWQALKPFCRVDASEEIKWYTLRKPVRWVYPMPRSNQRAFTEISRSTKKKS